MRATTRQATSCLPASSRGSVETPRTSLPLSPLRAHFPLPWLSPLSSPERCRRRWSPPPRPPSTTRLADASIRTAAYSSSSPPICARLGPPQRRVCLVFNLRHRRSPPLIRHLRAVPERAKHPYSLYVSSYAISLLPRRRSRPVAVDSALTEPRRRRARRRRCSGDHLALGMRPSYSPHHVDAVGAKRTSSRPPQPRPRSLPTPTTAKLVAGATPATPRPRHPHGWMRTSVRIP